MKKMILILLIIISNFLFILNASARENTSFKYTNKIEILKMEKLKETNLNLYNEYVEYKKMVFNKCESEFGINNYFYIIEKGSKDQKSEFNILFGGSEYSDDRFISACYKKGSNKIKPNISVAKFYEHINSYSYIYNSDENALYNINNKSDYFYREKDIYGALMGNMQNAENKVDYLDTNIDFIFSKNSFVIGTENDDTFNIENFILNDISYFENDFIIKNNTIEFGLKLKKTFNSGTNAPFLGKITMNIKAGTDTAAADGDINFKLQYGSNDFSLSKVPSFINYKLYGKKHENDNSWEEIKNDEEIYISQIKTDSMIVNGVTIPENITTGNLKLPNNYCKYELIMLEFYFDNVDNYYLYAYDDLYNSEWSDSQEYFNDYIFYYFPKEKQYAYVTHKKNIENNGKIFVNYNATINKDIEFRSYILNYENNTIVNKLEAKKFEKNDYYYYYDFKFNFDKKELLMLKRTKSEEIVGFYLHKDFLIQFSDNDKISVETPEGWVEINPDETLNQYELKNVSDFIKYFKSIVNINSDFINNFKNTWNAFRQNKLYSYFIFLIMAVLIVLVIKAFNRD